ncbi:MAG: hypothetical protein M1829_003321 [Trizodia sp. TS-e1964]|nr:MAG: hypothetical protein M1829_003321 [Trizodia sp. TS-e1964]
MASHAISTVPNSELHHRRTKSSVLKGLIVPRAHKRSPSDGEILKSVEPQNHNARRFNVLSRAASDDSQREFDIIGYRENGDPPRSPKKSKDHKQDSQASQDGRRQVKKTLSSVSLKSLAAWQKDNAKNKDDKEKEKERARKEDKPKKSKSRTNLVGLLSRPKSSTNLKQKAREDGDRETRDKENQSPPLSKVELAPPPIYAQFARQPLQESTSHIVTSVPLNDWKKNIDNEISLYTPYDYSPSKQRNFNDLNQRPRLSRSRPQSAHYPSCGSVTSFKELLSGVRKSSLEKFVSPIIDAAEGYGRRRSEEKRRSLIDKPSDELPIWNMKRGSRVMAAVAAFNGKMKDGERADKADKAESFDLDKAFEAILDARNTPLHMRPGLRCLDANIKMDMIKAESISSANPSEDQPGISLGIVSSKRPEIQQQANPRESTEAGLVAEDAGVAPAATKKARPRSRTFTFSKSEKDQSSPSKKQKVEIQASSGKTKSHERQRSGSSKSVTSVAAEMAGQLTGKLRSTSVAVPEEFVSYLRKVQRPQDVEVGKLHKLRLVLRNERVTWVDTFIGLGGMKEIVSLLNRIMGIEWREEHEDSLLHEVLLCLKALCTTTLALQHLQEIQGTLFPSLLHMLFDEEKKGPSEFLTRSIVTSLLLTYLAEVTNNPGELAIRARTILSYLRDPTPPEEEKPPGFIIEMHQSRPYRIWCKEVVNVTKEVFWIFLHHLNVVPQPPSSTPGAGPEQSYIEAHFPHERPPVPAAPYVGGVEWDATNYMASHLDLLNGLIAALPSRTERRALRNDLRASGFEKCLGNSLRACKEKFYGAVHDGLRTWVAAALADAWDVADVRFGVKEEVRKSPTKNAGKAPRLELAFAGEEKKSEEVVSRIGDVGGAWVY